MGKSSNFRFFIIRRTSVELYANPCIKNKLNNRLPMSIFVSDGIRRIILRNNTATLASLGTFPKGSNPIPSNITLLSHISMVNKQTINF
jgi:hypothetical protein